MLGSSKRDSTRLLTIEFLQYRARDKPWYRLGHGIVLIYIVTCMLASVAYYLTLRAENARRDQGIRDEIIEGVNDKGKPARFCILAAG